MANKCNLSRIQPVAHAGNVPVLMMTLSKNVERCLFGQGNEALCNWVFDPGCPCTHVDVLFDGLLD